MQPNQSLDELDLFLHCLLLEQSMVFQRQLLRQLLRRKFKVRREVFFSKLIYSTFLPSILYFLELFRLQLK